MPIDDLQTVESAALALGVSARQVRRLAGAGTLTRVAPNLVERRSVERYLSSQRAGRTRAWSAGTAWAAVALLDGGDAPWMGETQRSRLRGSLRKVKTSSELVVRCRDRARLMTFTGHPSAVDRLRRRVVPSNPVLLGLTSVPGDHVDGYVSSTDVETVVASLALTPDANGALALRVDMVRLEGGTQALRRTVDAHLEIVSGAPSVISVPGALGALVLEAAAYICDSRDRDRHLFDAAVLLACIQDPFAERDGFAGSGRRRIAALAKALTHEHPAWRALPDEHRASARSALQIQSMG